MSPRILTKEEVQDINTGKIPGMAYLEGTLEYSEHLKYILVPGTGSIVISGAAHKTMHEIMIDHGFDMKLWRYK